MTVNHEVDLYSDEFFQNPYPIYQRLRRELPLAPVSNGGYLVSRYEDALHVLRSPDFQNAPSRFSTLNARNRSKYPAADLANNILPFQDPPLHSKNRYILAKAFHQRFKNYKISLYPLAQKLVSSQLSSNADKSSYCFIKNISGPFATISICEFLGLNLNTSDSDQLRFYAETFFYLFAPISNSQKFEEVNAQIQDFRDFLETRINSSKLASSGFLNELIQQDYQGEKLSLQEVIDNTILLFADGIENVKYGAASVLMQLMVLPREILSEISLEQDKMQSCVREALRLETPAQIVPRIVARETRLHGIDLKPGTPVFVALGSANRDERLVSDSETFDLKRTQQATLTFGKGRHACIGDQLAIAQITALIMAFLQNAPGETASEQPSYVPRFGHRWPDELKLYPKGKAVRD